MTKERVVAEGRKVAEEGLGQGEGELQIPRDDKGEGGC
jgi:hypothetical protein